MSLKYSTTTADYLVWSDAMNLIRKLAKDGNYKISLLISLGCFTGLRISDILALRWKQILGTDEFTIIEKKTGSIMFTSDKSEYFISVRLRALISDTHYLTEIEAL